LSWRDLILMAGGLFLLYFAMGFAVFVELLNIRFRKVSQKPVTLHEPYVGKDRLRNLD